MKAPYELTNTDKSTVEKVANLANLDDFYI